MVIFKIAAKRLIIVTTHKGSLGQGSVLTRGGLPTGSTSWEGLHPEGVCLGGSVCRDLYPGGSAKRRVCIGGGGVCIQEGTA